MLTTPTPTTSRHLPKLGLMLAAAALLVACGGDDDDAADVTAADVTAAAAPAATAAPADDTGSDTASDAVVGVGSTELGEILVDANGLSLYGFLNDTGGTSACYDACAQAWPPLLVEGPDVPAGLDAAVFSTTERTDGTHQLVAGDWPLYTYFEDVAPGDVFGQGSGGAWYVVDPSGELIQDTSDATVGSDAAGRAYDY